MIQMKKSPNVSLTKSPPNEEPGSIRIISKPAGTMPMKLTAKGLVLIPTIRAKMPNRMSVNAGSETNQSAGTRAKMGLKMSLITSIIEEN
jgi:hypothetical protein